MGSSCEMLPSPFGLLTEVLQGSWLTPLNGGLAGMRSGILQLSFWADDCSCSMAQTGKGLGSVIEPQKWLGWKEPQRSLSVSNHLRKTL